MSKFQSDTQVRPPLPFRHPNTWRDNVEGILAAVVLVLIIRHFVFEVFKIPTGSMAPTLVGQHERVKCINCGYAFDVDVREKEDIGDDGRKISVIQRHPCRCLNCGYEFVLRKEPLAAPTLPAKRILFDWIHNISPGNRVIVNKFAAKLGLPKRWSVVVFVQPVKQLNYIKRLVGLPGEEITIWRGNLYADGKLLRKPESVQREVWRLVYDSELIPTKETRPAWNFLEGECRMVAGSLRMAPGRNRRAAVKYNRIINDRIAYNYYAPSLDYRPVGDLKWEVEVAFEKPGLLLLHLREDDEYYSAAIRFGEGGPATALLKHEGVLLESEFSLSPGRRYRVAFSNVDDRLALEVDGRRILEVDVPVALDLHGGKNEAQANGAWLEVRGGTAQFRRIRLYRDLYYLPNNGMRTYFADRRGYFVLGDNVQNSADSRMWGCYPEENFIGNAALVWWPLGYLRPIPYE